MVERRKPKPGKPKVDPTSVDAPPMITMDIDYPDDFPECLKRTTGIDPKWLVARDKNIYPRR